MCQLQVYYAFQILGKPSQVLVLFYSGAFLSKLEVRVGTQPHHATSGFLLLFFFFHSQWAKGIQNNEISLTTLTLKSSFKTLIPHFVNLYLAL